MSKKKENPIQEEEAKEEEQPVLEEPAQEEPQKKPSKKKEDSALTKAQEELAKSKEGLLRLAAEYDNYRKRTTSEKQNIYTDATASAVLGLLPVADSLDSAVKSLDGAPEDYKKGLELVKTQLDDCLTKLNVESFAEVGDEFNPELHNAVSKIENEDLSNNTVSLVFQKGYRVGDKIIRHAMVQVANCN